MSDQATILIVDDDPNILESVGDVMRIAGYKLVMAPNGVKALQALQYHQPDLIVSDIMMPEMDGYQFYDAVRRNPAWISIPFIFLSAKGEQKDIRHGYQLGADHYITKPFEPEDLVVAVQNRLRRVEEIQSVVYEEVEATKNQLLSIFGHELRTPLSYIYGYVSLLEEGHRDMGDEVMGEMMRGMRLGTERLIQLIEDLMLLITIDRGLVAAEIERFGEYVDLGHQIENAARALRPKAEQYGITLSTVLPKALMVHGMSAYIEDIIKRLIDNAIKFGKPGGHVWVRGETAGDHAVISVRDDGIGIEPENQEHLFGRFYQIDRGKMEQPGVGLGLVIAKKLAEAHQGDIHVESQPGKGSVFTVLLPHGSTTE
jgi:two-component system sensor histidine kinase/response regulator